MGVRRRPRESVRRQPAHSNESSRRVRVMSIGRGRASSHTVRARGSSAMRHARDRPQPGSPSNSEKESDHRPPTDQQSGSARMPGRSRISGGLLTRSGCNTVYPPDRQLLHPDLQAAVMAVPRRSCCVTSITDGACHRAPRQGSANSPVPIMTSSIGHRIGFRIRIQIRFGNGSGSEGRPPTSGPYHQPRAFVSQPDVSIRTRLSVRREGRPVPADGETAIRNRRASPRPRAARPRSNGPMNNTPSR